MIIAAPENIINCFDSLRSQALTDKRTKEFKIKKLFKKNIKDSPTKWHNHYIRKGSAHVKHKMKL